MNNLINRATKMSIIPIEDIEIHQEVIPFIKEKKINHIKYTMNRFGQQMPVVGNLVDGKFYIADGVVRYEVAKSLGWKTLICLDISVSNEDVVKRRMMSNQRTKMTYMEMVTYAEHTLGLLGKSQGKKRDSWLGMDDIDNDDYFGLAGKDRFELTCHLLDLPVKSSTLRKLIAIKQFENENPYSGIISGLDEGLFKIDRAFQLLKVNKTTQPKVKKEVLNVSNEQTSVEWFHNELKNLIRDSERTHMSPREFDNRNKQLLERAKQMEKERMIKFAKLCLDKSFESGLRTTYINVEEYYEKQDVVNSF
jgi:hypothetical protein